MTDGDYFDVLGSSQGWGSNLNAYIRYQFGWLGIDNVTVIKWRGSHSLAPINSANSGEAEPTLPVVAFIPSIGLNLEWRSGMDTIEAGAMLGNNPGFFVRRWQNLLDADLLSCEPLSWTDDLGEPATERENVTLRSGRTLNLRNFGLLVQADASGVADGNSQSFSVHFTGEPPPCVRAAPDIAVGMIGEWRYCETPETADGRCDFGSNNGLAGTFAATNYNRTTRHIINSISNRDSVGCGAAAAAFNIELASSLPDGWAFQSAQVSAFDGECVNTGFCSKAGYSPIGGGVSFGLPDDAPDGDYDFCLTVTNEVSGLRAAKILRVTLPESNLVWYTNNRPSSYSGVSTSLQASCDALNGACAPGVAGCTVPAANNCVADLACPSDGPLSEWGYCWGGQRVRGYNHPSVTQSVCAGGPSLLETEACEPSLHPPCADQQTCTVPSAEWVELRTNDGSDAMCSPSWTSLCAAAHGPDDSSFPSSSALPPNLNQLTPPPIP